MTKKYTRFLLVYTFLVVHVYLIFHIFETFITNDTLIFAIPSIIASCIFVLKILIDRKFFSFWGLLGGVIYIKNFYYYFLVYKFIVNGKDYLSALPYIEPTIESYRIAGFLLLLEVAVVLSVYILSNLKKTKKSNSGISVNFSGTISKMLVLLIVKLSILVLSYFNFLNGSIIDYIDFILTIVLYFEVVGYLNGKSKKSLSSFRLTLIATFITLFFIMSISRKQSVFFIISAFIFIKELYPMHKRRVNILLSVVTFVIVYFLTLTRFGDNAFLDLLTKPYRLESYFLPIRKTATAVEIFRFNQPIVGPSLIYDIFRPLILVGQLISSAEIPLSVDLFNYRLSYGGLYRHDQIYPLISQLFNYSVLIIVPIYSFILFLANKIQKRLDNSRYRDYRDVFFMTYLLLILSQLPITNLTITVNMISYQLLPVYILIRLSTKKGRAK